MNNRDFSLHGIEPVQDLDGQTLDLRDSDQVVEFVLRSARPRAGNYWLGQFVEEGEQVQYENVQAQAGQYLYWLNGLQQAGARVLSDGDFEVEIGRILDQQVSAAPDLAVDAKDPLWEGARKLVKIDRHNRMREVVGKIHTMAQSYTCEHDAVNREIERMEQVITRRLRSAERGEERDAYVAVGAVLGGATLGIIGAIVGSVWGAKSGVELGTTIGAVLGGLAGTPSGALAGGATYDRHVAEALPRLSADLQDLHQLRSRRDRIVREKVSVDTLAAIERILKDARISVGADNDPVWAKQRYELASKRIQERLRRDRARRLRGPRAPQSFDKLVLSATLDEELPEDARVQPVYDALIARAPEQAVPHLIEIAEIRNRTVRRLRSASDKRLNAVHRGWAKLELPDRDNGAWWGS